MKDKTYTLNTLLAAVLGIALFVCVLIRTFIPYWILPRLSLTNMVLISLAALVIDYYAARGVKRNWIAVGALGAVTFGLLPFAACFVGAVDALKLGIVGGVTFTVTAWLFDSMADRISTGPAAKAAPVVSALALYLAAQALMGMF